MWQVRDDYIKNICFDIFGLVADQGGEVLASK